MNSSRAWAIAMVLSALCAGVAMTAAAQDFPARPVRLVSIFAAGSSTDVNARFAETSKATVYNTLKLFLEKKLIRELIIDPNKVVYDPNTTPHHHFYDVATGRLTDSPADNIRIGTLPALPPGTVSDGVDIIIRTRPAA